MKSIREKLVVLVALGALTLFAFDVVGQSRSPYGRLPSTTASGTLTRDPVSLATVAAVEAIPATDVRRTSGATVMLATGEVFRFHPTSTAADASKTLVITPTAGTGRWLRLPGSADLALPAVTFASADAVVELTVPIGARLRVARCYFVNTIAWAGGTDAGVGLSSSQSPHNARGDLHGGTAGEVTAVMGTGAKEGTIGTDLAAGVILEAAATIVFDRVVDVYTSGAGVPHCVVDVLLNPGA